MMLWPLLNYQSNTHAHFLHLFSLSSSQSVSQSVSHYHFKQTNQFSFFSKKNKKKTTTHLISDNKNKAVFQPTFQLMSHSELYEQRPVNGKVDDQSFDSYSFFIIFSNFSLYYSHPLLMFTNLSCLTVHLFQTCSPCKNKLFFQCFLSHHIKGRLHLPQSGFLDRINTSIFACSSR